MRKLEASFRAIAKAKEASPEQLKAMVSNVNPDIKDAHTAGREMGITWDFFCDPSLVRKLSSVMTPVDMVNLYFKGVFTFYGQFPFELFLNDQMMQGMIGSKFATALDILEEESEFTPFLKPLIIDTGNFIATGKRQLPLKFLIGYHTDYVEQLKAENSANGKTYVGGDVEPSVKRCFASSHFNGMSSTAFFKAWIAQPDGLNDIQQAHRLLLGV